MAAPSKPKTKPQHLGFLARRVKPTEVRHVVNAYLPTLPPPLKPRVPLLVTVETWSDGVVAARLPAAALYGEGENDTEALDALGAAILDFARDVRGYLKEGEVGGPLLKQWLALLALVEVPHELD